MKAVRITVIIILGIYALLAIAGFVKYEVLDAPKTYDLHETVSS